MYDLRFEISNLKLPAVISGKLRPAGRPFMQNKANLRKSQVNVNLYNTTDYENKSDWTPGENKPNSKPIKPNFQKVK